MERDLYISFSQTEKIPQVDYAMKLAVRVAVEATLDYEQFPYGAEVSVTFCTPEHIRKLNKTYRGKDSATDVLSFPMYADGDFDPTECADSAMLGDIVISVDRAAEQASELGNTLLGEVAFLAIHSTLHLLGYDHERSAEDDEIQCKKQREIKRRLGDI